LTSNFNFVRNNIDSETRNPCDRPVIGKPYPRSPGLVIRLCLHFGIQPVFIPVSEPWRNAVIESFNDTYNIKYFQGQWFHNDAQLKRKS
jgi:hypothetical protein